MTQKELQNRLKTYSIDIVKFAESLPDSLGFRTIKNQIVRCGPSAAANYRAACRGKSTKDFKYKLEIVEEELDETLFWLEFTVGLDETKRDLISPYWKEGNELLSIIVSSINSIKKKIKQYWIRKSEIIRNPKSLIPNYYVAFLSGQIYALVSGK